MIIERVELENFMCYTGKNLMTFIEGINVVIGDNGYGKSKLYDAFYWVMYDQVFVPEKKEFQSTKAIKSKIISDKAKFETKRWPCLSCCYIDLPEYRTGQCVYVGKKVYGDIERRAGAGKQR